MKVGELIQALQAVGQPGFEIVVGDGESVYAVLSVGGTNYLEEEEVTLDVQVSQEERRSMGTVQRVDS